MRSILFLLFSTALTSNAAAPTWEALRLPAAASQRDIASYLKTVRLLANGEPPRVEIAGEERRAVPLDPDVVTKTRQALDAVLPQSLDLVLLECKASEKAWEKEQTDIYIQLPDGGTQYTGFRWANYSSRTPFTRVAFDRIAALPDITTAQRKLLLERVSVFPELILGGPNGVRP